ncbi:UvrD-helicase domain-containing protein [Georgenia sp. SUBG003]|uniref:UvrD-helicase domain-containing protein n=1 Tax=Georgenia sp. SUBG003 TaxID=1497974 RepID=UPI003AB21067
MTPDSEQAAVIEAAPEERLVIVAGPGAGKTAVIVERVRALIEDGGLDRPGDILVVSFSRAAVGVVADRLAGRGRGQRRGGVRDQRVELGERGLGRLDDAFVPLLRPARAPR